MIQAGTALLRRYQRLSWSIVDQAMLSGINFLTILLLARALGPVNFGIYSLAWMSVLLAAGLQHSLVTQPMMSIAPKISAAESPVYFGAVVVQQLVVTSLSFALIWTLARISATFFPEWGIAELAFPLAVTVSAYQTRDFFRRYFFTINRGQISVAVDAIGYLGQFAVLAGLYATVGLTASTALWVIAGTSALACLAAPFFLAPLAWPRDQLASVVLRHWRFGGWLAASVVLRWVSRNAYLIAAGAIVGPAAIGAIRAAQNLFGPIQMCFLALENVAPIRASWHYDRGGVAGLTAYLWRIMRFGGLGGLAIALPFVLFPEFWLTLLFGEAYAGYGELVVWFTAVYAVTLLGIGFRFGLRAIEDTRSIFFTTMLNVILALVIAEPIVTWLGIVGGVVGGLLSVTLSCTVQFSYLWWRLRELKKAE